MRHWAAGSGRPQCRLGPTVTVRICVWSATLSPLARPQGRLRTLSAQANCAGPCTPPVYDLLNPHRAAGQGAPSVGQGLTVTAAPSSDPHSRSVSQVRVYGVAHSFSSCLLCRSASATSPCRTLPLRPDRGAWRSQCRPRANCHGCTYPQPALAQFVTGLRGPGPTVSAKG